MQNLLIKLKHLLTGYVFKIKPSGLEETPHDARDFKTDILGWTGYQPKHQSWIIPTVSTKDQKNLLTCQWNATTIQKEIDENVELSVRHLVIEGKQAGLTGYLGSSNLRSGQKMLLDSGIVEATKMPEGSDTVRNDWSLYTGLGIQPFIADARQHKIKTYWSVSSKDDVFRLLDIGRVMTTGMTWYSGFNQGGGFKSPWLITRTLGYAVGGHALGVIGYNLNYQGRKVAILKNSYGEQWGGTFVDQFGHTVKGCFAIDIDFLIRQSASYGFYANLDIDRGLAQLLAAYSGHNIKGDASKGIYFVYNGMKHVYPSWDAFISYTGSPTDYVEIPQADVDTIPEGSIMDIQFGQYYQLVSVLKKPLDFINK